MQLWIWEQTIAINIAEIAKRKKKKKWLGDLLCDQNRLLNWTNNKKQGKQLEKN